MYDNGASWPRLISLPNNSTSADWNGTTAFNIQRYNGTNTIDIMENSAPRAALINTYNTNMLGSWHFGASAQYR